ncbi:hypothetical protein MCOR27_003227 [Pyricularia oryzae]|uniref:Uncharacterized protein n=2 Tax=Pyricularia TaxID=48558 RepID=A0ABQ8NQ94_PYRGI|nr:hypothetical protein MCOR01_004814 [Pyricularia oryzae]KAI6300569.1 hypothetical protein MCOR33_003728 [Pyricularia grisea]KAH9431558.1 hypothetical protein MCOR02_008847 [Pyricularia oryzae]KAI6257903.1 hypothetical protein MCOR19_005709 [Pyricularia oryzae]KAI6283486.1 hypothetical protein MCOR27_003227 [Pyricularia oryzae]
MPSFIRSRAESATSYTSRSTTWSTSSSDDDAITPVTQDSFLPPPMPAAAVPTASETPALELRRPASAAGSMDSRSSSSSTATSSSSSSSLCPAVDAADLWRRMLAVQRIYHCYNSARISAALDNEVLQKRIPSRACLDLLNDGISHLPEDEKQQVVYFIEHGKVQQRKSRSFWRRRLVRTP